MELLKPKDFRLVEIGEDQTDVSASTHIHGDRCQTSGIDVDHRNHSLSQVAHQEEPSGPVHDTSVAAPAYFDPDLYAGCPPCVRLVVTSKRMQFLQLDFQPCLHADK